MNWRGVFQAASQNKLVGSTKKKKKLLSNNLIRTLIMFPVFVVFHHELRNGWMKNIHYDYFTCFGLLHDVKTKGMIL